MHVLLVETDRELPFVRELLTSFADSVTRAPQSAVTRASGEDLVVIARDVWGDEATAVCSKLHGERLLFPLLAVSGPCDARERAAALRAGADDFLAIPFDVEELVARAFALVRRASSGLRVLRVGVFSLDLGRREIAAAGSRIPLTLREYDVLALLIERAGEVVTRGELTGHLATDSPGHAGETPRPTTSDSNVVDVHVSRIRDKLGEHASTIETVRGLGYRLRSRAPQGSG